MAYAAVKKLIQTAEPYQATIAGGIILAKLGWRVYKQAPLNREIRELNRDIGHLRAILRSGALNADPARFEAVANRIEELRFRREEKKRQLSYAALTFGQIPNLFFAHPGSNIYQGVHQIVSRGVIMRDTARPINPRALTRWERAKNLLSLAGGIISLAGTTASLGRMTGFIPSDNRTSHIFSYLAIGVHTLEGCWMAKDAIANAFRYLTARRAI